jgi:Arc/MetJ family transcription regulator
MTAYESRSQVDMLGDDEVRAEAIRAFDLAIRARARRQRAMRAAAEAEVERNEAEDASQNARGEMEFWENVLIERGLIE